MSRMLNIKHHIREKIAYLGSYSNEHPCDKTAYRI